MPLLRQLRLAASVLVALSGLPALAHAEAGIVTVPPGNRSATQPPISGSSIARTAETKSTFDEKYRTIVGELARDRALVDKIEQVAGLYGIDPIHMIGAIVGEHTYNVDVFDTLQGYYVKAMAYLGSNPRFAYKGEDIRAFVSRPQFAECAGAASDYDLWTCRENVWKTVFQGKVVDGTAFPNDRMQRVFFQPFFAGQTFGLGQLSPLAALTVADVVAAKTGHPALSLDDPAAIYHAVMDPDLSLNYMAAIIRHDIDVYRAVAGFDISGNPGLTATLYNLGDAAGRARALAAENRQRRARGEAAALPQENYYGWLVNDRLDELKKLL
jgi:hypothetical protein